MRATMVHFFPFGRGPTCRRVGCTHQLASRLQTELKVKIVGYVTDRSVMRRVRAHLPGTNHLFLRGGIVNRTKYCSLKWVYTYQVDFYAYRRSYSL